jgi:uncharacterized protein (DUF849 family)
MVITIKHSGSLVTLSAQGFAAKNSLDNEFTAGAAVLLHAHFVRLLGSEDAALQRLAAFMAALQQRQLAISFEMVTGEGHTCDHRAAINTLFRFRFYYCSSCLH